MRLPILKTSDNERISFKHWADDEKPREKLLAYGPSILSNAELLAVLLGSGSPNEDVLALSRRILADAGNNLHVLAQYTEVDWKRYKGVGEAKTAILLAVIEFQKRRQEQALPYRSQILSSNSVFQLLSPYFTDLLHEEMWALYLSNSMKLIGRKLIGRGGLAGTSADIRLIFKYGLDCHATSVILCHNHPSGITQPSDEDTRLTNQVNDAGKLMKIALHDHLIFGNKAYFSFGDEGLIER